MEKLIKKLLRKLFWFRKKDKVKTWQDIEYFNESWKNRIKQMTQYISPNSIVLDLGCGQMWTNEFLPINCKYIAVDYIKRDEKSIVCDFNQHQFTDINADIAFVSGCFEYVVDYNWFVNKIATYCNACVISYCTLEAFPNLQERKGLTWVNHLTKAEFINLFLNANFTLEKEDTTQTNNTIFIFKKL